VKRGRFDKNPVGAVRQWQEPPGRDHIVSPAEFRTLWDKADGDREMRAFLALAGTTTMRKGEVLSLRWIESTWRMRHMRRWFAPRPDISGTCRSRSSSSER
jgi:integrase